MTRWILDTESIFLPALPVLQGRTDRSHRAGGYTAAAVVCRRELWRLLRIFPLLFAEIEDRREWDRAARCGEAVERANRSGMATICGRRR